MKVSLHIVKQYLSFELPALDELVTTIGSQLGQVEEVIDNRPKYEQVRVAKVVSCQPLQDSDHLNVCLVDDGRAVQDVQRNDDGLVQVVCGAPNVREGMLVAWLPPGATVPSTYGATDPFVLSVRPLRGVDSNGMLASAKELALGDDHDGILQLDDGAKPGDSFAQVYGLDDVIIDIENKMFTHRPDCFGQLGIARELSGIFGHLFDESKGYISVSELQLAQPEGNIRVNITNEIPELVPRFTTQVFENVAVGQSPVRIQAALVSLGIRPINNIVDITNYVMALTGQPTHAYDYDKVAQLSNGDPEPTMVIRQPHSQEQIVLLNGKTISPRSEAILIATPSAAIGIAGVMGGLSTEVSATTSKIIFEVANFDMYNVRKTSMAHGLFSEAVTRFSKGQSPLQTLAVLYIATDMLIQTGAIAVGPITDDNHLPEQTMQRQSVAPAITITTDFINQRLGSDLDTSATATLLSNVGFTVEQNGDKLQVLAPFWRTDIELREDVIEEVGRLYGYDRLPTPLPLRSLAPSELTGLLPLKNILRTSLAAAGANELLTYSFVHGNLLKKVGQDTQSAYKISNALSPDLQYVRPSLTPSLLDKVHANVKAGYEAFALFEIGRSHTIQSSSSGPPEAREVLALVYTATLKSGFANGGAAYYNAKNYLEYTLKATNRGKTVRFEPVAADNFDDGDISDNIGPSSTLSAPFALQRSAWVYVDDTNIGIIGEYRLPVQQHLKLPHHSAGFEIDLGVLQSLPANLTTYFPLSKFPKVTQDITLKVSDAQSYSRVYAAVIKGLSQGIEQSMHYSVEPLAIYAPNSSDKIRFMSFRIAVTSAVQTLTEQHVSALLDNIIAVVALDVEAERA